jgi:hypothetical protein
MGSNRPVLFLDVDGVLHPFHAHKSFSHGTTFHKTCMENLQRIISETDAEIVLSSSWRNFVSMRNRLQANLCEYGLTFTRWVEPDSVAVDQAPSVSVQKMSKILSFVHAHYPRDWVVLDDEDLVALSGIDDASVMVQLFGSRFVQTDPSFGLTLIDAEKVINLLSSDE